MPNRRRSDKPSSSQYLLQLGYDGGNLFGVAPQAAGPAVWDQLCARLARAPGWVTPYAVSWAARTDRGVHARRNWVSFRLADGGATATRAALLAAARAPALDALTSVRAMALPTRAMARNLAVAKHYRYRLADAVDVGVAARARLDAAARALSGTLDVRRLAHARTVRELTDTRRTGITVVVAQGAPGLTIDVTGPGFVRHQVRHMVQVMVQAMHGTWRLADVAWLARGDPGPPPRGLNGPAAANGLCLEDLIPHPAWAAILLEGLNG